MRKLCCLGVLTALALSIANLQAAESRDSISVVFVGDIMLADSPGKAVAAGIDPFAEFSAIFQAADIMIGNLECVVATTGTAEDKPYTFRAQPHCIPLLKRHFTALTIANNHYWRFRQTSARGTVRTVRKSRIAILRRRKESGGGP